MAIKINEVVLFFFSSHGSCPFLSFYLHWFSKTYLCLDVLQTNSQASHMGSTMPLFVDWYQETSPPPLPFSECQSHLFRHYSLKDLFGDFVSMVLNLIPSLAQAISTHDRSVQHKVLCSHSWWQFVRWHRCCDLVPSYDFLFMHFFADQLNCIHAL